MNYFFIGLIFALPNLSWADAIKVAPTGAPKNTPEMITKGKAAYVINCLACHGEKGNGLGVAGKYMSPKPRNFIVDKFKNGEKVDEVFTSITKGLDGTGMVGFEALPEADRWAMAYYVQSFKAKK